MALDFPNSPTVGQIFTGGMGSWQWDGVKWVPYGESGGGTVTSVTAGTGLTGGTITTSGTIALSAPVSIANGGTNATTASTALANLNGLPLSGGTLTGPLTGTSLTLSGALTGVTATFSGALTPTGGIQGVTNASNAAAGQVGEFLTASIGGTAITNNTLTTLLSLALTAGDWDCWGSAFFSPAGFTMNFAQAGLSASSSSMPPQYPEIYVQTSNLNYTGLTLNFLRMSLSAAGSVYVNVQAGFTSTCNCSGTIFARRVR